MKTRTHWTISALKEYESCPAKYRWSYLFDADDWREIGYTIVPSRDSPAMTRGTQIHETIEHYLKGIGDMPLMIGPAWQQQIEALRHTHKANAEEQWEFSEGWHTDGPLWLRMKIDAWYPQGDAYHVIDFKTGKPYPANVEQIEVYALGAFARFDDALLVQGSLWYLDHDEPQEKTFMRKDAARLSRKWEQRANRMLDARTFPERKNKFCNWCPYSRTKGGPCSAA